jgi:biotin transport system ATP-binding protein
MPDIITVSNISKRFPVDADTEGPQIKNGFFYAIDDVSFHIEAGTCTLICGANGSGKSLLMSIIAGLDTPDSGTVVTTGRVGLIFQDPDSQILGETAREDIAFGVRNIGVPKREIRTRVEQALAETGLESRADFPSRSLSGGEKRRLAAAGILAMGAETVIFDEPYANMDYPSVVQVNRQIQKLRADNKTIIILTHEIEKCLGMADSFLVLFRGKKVFEGSPARAMEQNLETWGIRHPLRTPAGCIGDLVWL